VLASRKIATVYGDVYSGMPLLCAATIYMAVTTGLASMLMADDSDQVVQISLVPINCVLVFLFFIHKHIIITTATCV
jgi:hypothetical protein